MQLWWCVGLILQTAQVDPLKEKNEYFCIHSVHAPVWSCADFFFLQITNIIFACLYFDFFLGLTGNATSDTQTESLKQTPYFEPSKNFRDDYPYLTSSNDVYDEAEYYYSSDEAYSSCNDVRNVLSRTTLCLLFSCVYVATQLKML